MQWSDEGIVLGTRAYGESGVVLEVLTRDHGRHFGLVHGGRSRKMQPVLQPGNQVALGWRARLEEQLGSFQVELVRSRAGSMLTSPRALNGLATLIFYLHLLPERDPHPNLFEAAALFLDGLDEPWSSLEHLIRFELLLLAEMGYGLDLGACAATGTTENLAYVSPKSGCAVSAEAGEPWKDKLLILPRFLLDTRVNDWEADYKAGSDLSGYFVAHRLLSLKEQPLPQVRAQFVESIFCY